VDFLFPRCALTGRSPRPTFRRTVHRAAQLDLDIQVAGSVQNARISESTDSRTVVVVVVVVRE
jgi:hypothetical protein